MKALSLLILALSSSFGSSNEVITAKLDELFDLRIKVNKEYKKQFTEDAKELENAEARKFLVKREEN